MGGHAKMPLESPRELFVHELADMLSAEHIIAGVLPVLSKEALHPEVKKAFTEHETETKEHIRRLNQAFKVLGETPEKTTCHAAEGLKEEHDALLEEQPTPEILQMGDLGGAAKTEHYEIASYTAAAQMATDLGEREVAAILKATLAEEKAMLKRVDALAKQLGQEAKTAAKAS
jgi:ferritin-like metal-binding protein YciE